MKLMAQLAAIGALIAGATTLNAQTNIDLNVNIALNGVVQTGDTASKGHGATKDVIQALVPGASSKAKLLARFSPDGGDPAFIVSDGGNETDVTGSLSTRLAGNEVDVTTDKGNGLTTVKSVQIREFILSTDTISFDVQGYTTANLDNKGLNGETFANPIPTSASAKVAGNLTVNGDSGVAQGVISLSGRKITETP